MEPRPYQTDCFAAIDKSFREYTKSLAVLPTGSGKTCIFSWIAARTPGRVLIVAHREELIQQAKDKLERATGIVAEIERADEQASLDARVVVASVQTLCRRFEKYPANHFALVIVDEAHHCLAKSYQSFLDYFLDGGAKVLGVTATPNTRGKKALGNFFQDIAYEIGLMDLIRAGYLAPITVKSFPLHADLKASALDLGEKLVSAGGDYNENVAAHALEPFLEDIVRRMRAIIGQRKTVVFVPLVATAHKFADLCAQHGLSAAAISGQSEDRAEILRAFGHGDTQVLINSMLLTEGWDEPKVQCIVPLRPTRSEILFSQIVGRGTRVWCPFGHTEACRCLGRKKDLLLLDPLWLHEDMSLVRPARLVTGHEEDQKRIAATGDGDLLAMLEDAEHERETALAERLKKLARRRAKTISVEEWALITHDPDVAEFEPTMHWHGMAPSDKQLALLAKLGFDADSITSRGQAKVVLDKFFARKGMATPRQLVHISRLKMPDFEKATFEQAKAFLDEKWGKKAVAA